MDAQLTSTEQPYHQSIFLIPFAIHLELKFMTRNIFPKYEGKGNTKDIVCQK